VNATYRDRSSDRYARNKLNVLLIVADAVRHDYCSYSGIHNNTTPNLDNIKSSAYFHNCFSTSPWTLPSHASLFSGLYPSQHGTHVGEGGTLHFTSPSFVEDLSRFGYATVAFSANPIVCPLLGFNRGFKEFYEITWRRWIPSKLNDPVSGLKRILRMGFRWLYYRTISGLFPLFAYRSAEKINQHIKTWFTNAEEPFFIFINYMDVHDYHSTHSQGLIDRMRQKLKNPNPSQRYRYSLNYLDNMLGDLIKLLESHGLIERTALIITSDHGEMLGEYNLLGHKVGFPYNTLLHVPLVIRDPNSISEDRIDISQMVSIKDIGSIILHIIQGKPLLECIKNLPDWVGAECFRGIDEIGWIRDQQGSKTLRIKGTPNHFRAVIKDHFKLIHNVPKNSLTLYKMSPNEEETQNAHVLQALTIILKKWEEQPARVYSLEYTPEEKKDIRERLRRLGYL